MTIKEASQEYEISIRTLQNWCKSGKLKWTTNLHPETHSTMYIILNTPENIEILKKGAKKTRPKKWDKINVEYQQASR